MGWAFAFLAFDVALAIAVYVLAHVWTPACLLIAVGILAAVLS